MMLQEKDFDTPPLEQLEQAAEKHDNWEVIRGVPDLLIRSQYNKENIFLCMQPDNISIDIYISCNDRADPRGQIDGEPVEPNTKLTVTDFHTDLISRVDPEPYITNIELTPDDVDSWMCGCGTGG